MVHWSLLPHMILGMSWCPTPQPWRYPQTMVSRSCLGHNSASWLELRIEWAKSHSVQGLVPPSLRNNREKIKQSPAASVSSLWPKRSQETLDPNQISLGFCKSSMVRTCSTFYPNILFSRWDSRRHFQCCYIHLLYPICHAMDNVEAIPAQPAHPAHGWMLCSRPG